MIEKAVTEKKQARAKRSWRRRLLRLALALAGLLIALRIALPFALPTVLDSLLAESGLQLRYDRLDLSLLSGTVLIERAELLPIGEDRQPIVTLEYARVDLDLPSLLSGGALHFHRVDVVGAEVWLQSDEAGDLVLLPGNADAPLPDADLSADGAGEEFDLTPPVFIDAASLQRVRVHVRDPDNSADHWIEASLRLANLGTATSTDLEVRAYGPDLVDALAIDVTATIDSVHAEATFALNLRGLQGHHAETWLHALGLKPDAELLAASVAGTVRVAASATSGATELAIELDNARVIADRVEQVALDRAEAKLELAPDRSVFRELTVQGLRGKATLLETGGLLLAGLEISPAATASTTDGQTAQPGTPLLVDSISLTDVDVSLRDQTVEPALDLQIFADLKVRDLVGDAGGQRGSFELRGRLPGIVSNLEVEGQVSPFTETLFADLEVRASGITLAGLAPYLQDMGLKPTLRDGRLAARVTAQVHNDGSGTTLVSAAIENLDFTDGEPLLRADRIAVGNLLTESTRTRLDQVEVVGLELFLLRDPEGAVHGLGLQNLRSTVSRAGQAAQVVESAAQRQAGAGSRFELASLQVRDAVLHIEDHLLGAVLGPGNLALDLQNLAFGGAAEADAPGDVAQLDLRMTGALAESLQITGSVTTHPGPLDAVVDLSLRGDGVHLTPLEPYLRDLGIEPRIRDGQARATLAAEVRLDQGGNLEFSAQITDLTLSSADNVDGISWQALSFQGGSIAADGLTLEQVRLEAPVVKATREKDGRLRIAGFVLSPAADTPADTPDAPAPDASAADAPITFTVASLALNEGVLQWRDETMNPPVDAHLTLTVAVERLNNGPGATPMPVSLTLTTNGAETQARLEGEITLDPDDLRATLQVEAQGLRAGPFAPYLPAAVRGNTGNGHFTGDLRARVSTSTVGGQAIELVAENLLFRDADSGTLLAQAEAIRILAPRIDPQGRVYHFSEISTRGLQLRAQINPDASLSALGLTIKTAGETPAETISATTPGEDPDRTETAPATTEASVGRAAPPRVLVDKLDLEVRRLALVEPGGEPLELRLHLTNPAPLLLLDENPEALSPLLLHLEGVASPLVEQITLDLQAIPWHQEARLDLDLQVSGIKGRTLESVMPSLAAEVGAGDLIDGELSARIRLFSDLRRRDVLDFDLSRGFTLNLWLEEFALRDTPDGRILLGVEEMFLHASRITPTMAHVTSLDIDDLTGRAWHDEEGLHIAGLTLKSPQPEEPASRAELQTPTESPFELIIERLTTSGLDFEYRNTLSDPPLFIPFNGLDLELEDFTTRAFSEPVPVRFSLSLTAGATPLPVRAESTGLVVNIVSTAGSLVGGKGEVQLEDRLLMEELSVQGDMTLYPPIEGRLRANLTSLELMALRGPAAQGGVRIGDGVLDGGVDMRFDGARGVFTDANLTFTHLAIEETTDGTISQFLSLPAPLNAVIFLLKNHRDEVVIPLSFHTDETGIATGAIYREAIRAFRSLVTDAIAASPYRIGGALTGAVSGLVSGIGGLLGLGGGEQEPDSGPPPLLVTFSPGDSTLSSATRTTLDQVADLLRRDRTTIAILHHEFGPADLEQAALLANPSREQTLALVTNLRQRRAGLIRTRAQVAADARVDHAVGRIEQAQEQTQRLQDLDNQLGQAEDSLDRVLQLLRPNAERRTEHRTRATALAIGNERLQAVGQYLIDATGPDYADRIEVRRAGMRVVPLTEDQQAPAGQVTATTRKRSF